MFLNVSQVMNRTVFCTDNRKNVDTKVPVSYQVYTLL
jgi:hypothetical protein